jgi:hypothetical protein
MIARAAMAPAPPMQRETVRRAVISVGAIGPAGVMRTVGAVWVVRALTLLRRLLRLAAGDEGRKPLHVLLAARLELLRARLIVLRLIVQRLVVLRLIVLRLIVLRLTVLRLIVLRLTVLGLIVLRLIVLRLIVLGLIVLRLIVLRLIVLRLLLLAWIKRLRLARGKRLAADGRLLVTVLIVAVIGNIASRLALLLVIGRALAELLLRRRDQAEVMLGMLIIILGRDWVAGTLRVAGKLEIFFGDVRRRSPNFHVRSV